MSWLRDRANTVASYYSAIDPADFYEWKFSQTIPKGARFTKHIPPSQVFAEGLVIVSADISSQNLKSVDPNTYKVKESTPGDINLVVGSVLSPSELIEKYKNLKEMYSKNLNMFRESLSSQKYTIDVDNKLCRIADANGQAHIDKFDTLPEIQKKLTAARRVLTEKSRNRTGRAYELEALRRFEHAFVLSNNKGLTVHPDQIDYLLRVAEVEPSETYKIPWSECFVKMSKDARTDHERIKTLDSMQWIQEAMAIVK